MLLPKFAIPSAGSLVTRARALSYGSAADANYTFTAADLGKTITVVASYTDGGSFDHNVSSGGTAAIQPIYTPIQPNHFVDLNSTVNLK